MPLFILCVLLPSFSYGRGELTGLKSFKVSGVVYRKGNKEPVPMAVIKCNNFELWATADENGKFSFAKVPAGVREFTISSLGYATVTVKLNVDKDITNYAVYMDVADLSLKEVTVTAEKNKASNTTQYTIDKAAIEQSQLTNISDVLTLLPGGQSIHDPKLTKTDKNIGKFQIRAASSFGTAVEVDGVRLSTNSDYTEGQTGADTRNIGTSNVESVNVISGVASVEYGDLSSGIVVINTQKGASPLKVDFTYNPNTKQVSLSKGVRVGKGGVLNFNYDRARSVASLMSPYTKYTRNALTLTYSNTFARKSSSPLRFEAGIGGNIGGRNQKSDPDAYSDTYSKAKNNNIRGHFKFNWLVNGKFITNAELKGSVNYSYKRTTDKSYKSSATALAAVHGTEEGYFVATDYDTDPNAAVSLIPPGYWYQTCYNDDKPMNGSASLKINSVKEFSNKIRNHFKLGVEYSFSGNYGKGIYYKDPQTIPDGWREYRYKDVPFYHTLAPYAEESVSLPLGSTVLGLTAGIRGSYTHMNGSEYGNISAYSPRFNLTYRIVNDNNNSFLKYLNIKGGIGKSVKLPSSGVLYPRPYYTDELTFAPGALADGTSYYAYYIRPATMLYNPDLKWQYTLKKEIGIDMKIKNVKISLVYFDNKTFNRYSTTTGYDPFAYNFTDQSNLESCTIPLENRKYNVDRNTGIVTVIDKTGVQQSEILSYTTRETFKKNSYCINEAPSTRKGLEWVVDFGKIKSLQTSFRLDGIYYRYKYMDKKMSAGMPGNALYMADGSPYRYVGFYSGDRDVSNGQLKKQFNANATIITHIPQLRLIVSLRVESSLYSATRNLSTIGSGTRAYVLDSREDYLPSTTISDLKDHYAAVYPDYYVSYDDLTTKIPFLPKLKWAKNNDPALYAELCKLVVKSNTSYYLNTNRISPYFSANIDITKEIGRHFSISFYANNFLNNMNKVKQTWNHTKYTLYQSSQIPLYYYGLTLRIKI